MLTNALSLLTLAAAGSALTIPSSATPKRQSSISITPHDMWSSSIGVLGCKIDVNRVAYWPSAPGCDDMCVQVSANGRTVNLLHVDQSGGAYDISYDAWNYLYVGESARDNPQQGGGFDATYTPVSMDNCADIITEPNGLLAFSAANSMNFISSCPAGTWVGDNHALYNILNPVCTYGVDETCVLESGMNQATCPSGLGSNAALTTQPVYNLVYGTGEEALAL